MLKPLSRERRLAVMAASLASISAALGVILMSVHTGLGDFTHGLIFGVLLGTSIGLLAVASHKINKCKSTST